MKPVIAYAQLLLGFPILLAYLAWYFPNLLIEKIWGSDNISTCYDMFRTALEGFLALIFAYLLFDYLQVDITIWIPVILCTVSSLWRLGRNEGFMIMFVNLGILIAYKLFPYWYAGLNRW